MFRDDFEFHDGAGALASRRTAAQRLLPRRAAPQPSRAAIDVRHARLGRRCREGTAARSRSSCAARRAATPRRFADEHGLATITVETLYDAKAHFGR